MPATINRLQRTYRIRPDSRTTVSNQQRQEKKDTRDTGTGLQLQRCSATRNEPYRAFPWPARHRRRLHCTVPVGIVTVLLWLTSAADQTVILFKPARHSRRQSHTAPVHQTSHVGGTTRYGYVPYHRWHDKTAGTGKGGAGKRLPLCRRTTSVDRLTPVKLPSL